MQNLLFICYLFVISWMVKPCKTNQSMICRMEVTGSMVAFAKLQGLVGGNAAVPGGNVPWPLGGWLVGYKW